MALFVLLLIGSRFGLQRSSAATVFRVAGGKRDNDQLE
jgi:hypothetical protein